MQVDLLWNAPPITLSAKNMKAATFLDWMAALTGSKWTVADGVVIMSNDPFAMEPPSHVFYPLDWLLGAETTQGRLWDLLEDLRALDLETNGIREP